MNSHPKRPRDPNQLAGPDQPRGRPHVDIGTKIEIPNSKLKWDQSNPAGHGIVVATVLLRTARGSLTDQVSRPASIRIYQEDDCPAPAGLAVQRALQGPSLTSPVSCGRGQKSNGSRRERQGTRLRPNAINVRQLIRDAQSKCRAVQPHGCVPQLRHIQRKTL